MLGKIELPTETRRKPAASSDGEKKRKRTERARRRHTCSAGQTTRRGLYGPQCPTAESPQAGRENRDQRQGDSGQDQSYPGPPEWWRKIESFQDPACQARRACGRARTGITEQGQKIIKVTEFVTANELAKLMNVTVTEIISTCMSLGLFVLINQRLDAETLSVVAEEFGFKVEFVSADVQDSRESGRRQRRRPRRVVRSSP